jgi:hypothetical protein
MVNPPKGGDTKPTDPDKGWLGCRRKKHLEDSTMKYVITILAVLLTLGFIGTADAFHGGGVAHCDGCHSMHDSPENPVSGVANSTLLLGSDASSTCLNCHDGAGSYHIADEAGVSNAKAGGDFGWLKNEYFVVVRGRATTYGGDNAGHNINAFDFGYAGDANPNNATAPGGTAFGGYGTGQMGCASCHDPHGQVLGGTAGGSLPISVSGSYGGVPDPGTITGNYRLLGDSGYSPTGETALFANDAPIARANGSSGLDTAYGLGMSEWCANCHDQYSGSGTRHVAPWPLNGIGANYNSYVATGDFTGVVATAYDELVPFEVVTGVTSSADLNLASTVGAMPGAQVMCLTCHRAHATANNNAGRWDFEAEYLGHSHALATTNLPSTAAIYYNSSGTIDVDAVYGAFQRSLCNKCHVQD